MLTTVAIPVLNGAHVLGVTLDAVRRQADVDIELVVCDSGSRDGSVELARGAGAEVVQIPKSQFGHGRTRNLLMQRSRGEHVAFLTQDSVPEGDRWLSRLLAGFSQADDVALVYGPYRPRPDASPMVARELTVWFAGFSPDGRPQVDRLGPADREIDTRELLGRRGFFTDANGCISRAAWERIPFRDASYAEDQLLAIDMMRAGYAKVFVPDAGVIHSHDYSPVGWLHRSFDEARALRDVYGFAQPLSLRAAARNVYGRAGADLRWARAHGMPAAGVAGLLTRSVLHHGARTVGTVLGGRHDRLPPALVQRLSLERRRT